MREREELPDDLYEAQIRDIRRAYGMISVNPQLSQTWVGNEARARLDTLDSRVNPRGANMPLIHGLNRLVR